MNQTVKTFGEQAADLANEAAAGAEQAMRSSQHAAQQGLNSLSGARAQADSALHQLAADTANLGHRGMDAVRESGELLREKSAHAREATTHYIQHEPIKSVLMAAAVGAALMGVVALLGRHHGGSGR
jgi:ElaB/YqjD/DUF883 family membrane-anchored ribosome-binding protein